MSANKRRKWSFHRPPQAYEADPEWLGPAALVSLVLVSILLALMLHAVREPGR